MITIKELDTDISKLDNNLKWEIKCFKTTWYGYYGENPRYYLYKSPQLTEQEFEEMTIWDLAIRRMQEELNYLKELKHQMVEHQKKMIQILLQLKTFIEVKSFQKMDVLNDDVNILIIGYLTGISNKIIKDQLKLF